MSNEIKDLGPANSIHRHDQGPYKHTQHERNEVPITVKKQDNSDTSFLGFIFGWLIGSAT